MLRQFEYTRADGAIPYRSWLKRIDPLARAKVTAAVSKLQHGNTSNLKRIGSISELRIDWGPGYRVYLAIEQNTLLILFGGGTKHRQSEDILHAKELYFEYKTRKSRE